ncbi:glycosyltransferase family 2 protein [Novosphingobium sp. BL-8H]|uniref:glycosyltransferase family 2 protein n=1 Tax=Novosphingobium sp. BL-8H TaxID=3127640 RepID=UPI003757C059
MNPVPAADASVPGSDTPVLRPIPTPSIDVVIVNYRSGPLAISCLESLAAERTPGLRLRAFVVDNASPDNSATVIEQAIARHGWDWARLIHSPVNGGFGAGNNLGFAAVLAQETPADVVWLLNPDTRVMPGAAKALARFIAQMPAAGIVGTGLLEADGAPWPHAFRFPSILGELERGLRWRVASRLLARSAVSRRMGGDPAPVDWVSGASMAIRREVLEAGLRFDEGFFLYFEETDFCRMARAEGWQSWYLPQAVVLHISGQSTGVTAKDAGRRRMPGYWFDSRRHYFLKNHGRAYAVVADMAWMMAHATYTANRMLARKPQVDPDRLMFDFARHSALVPQGRRGRLRASGRG